MNTVGFVRYSSSLSSSLRKSSSWSPLASLLLGLLSVPSSDSALPHCLFPAWTASRSALSSRASRIWVAFSCENRPTIPASVSMSFRCRILALGVSYGVSSLNHIFRIPHWTSHPCRRLISSVFGSRVCCCVLTGFGPSFFASFLDFGFSELTFRALFFGFGSSSRSTDISLSDP